METKFSIVVTLSTPAGIKSFGRFELVSDSESAMAIFNSLKGNDALGYSRCINIELQEQIADLLVPIAIKKCNLNELKENTAIIAREIFKIHHLEQ